MSWTQGSNSDPQHSSICFYAMHKRHTTRVSFYPTVPFFFPLLQLILWPSTVRNLCSRLTWLTHQGHRKKVCWGHEWRSPGKLICMASVWWSLLVACSPLTVPLRWAWALECRPPSHLLLFALGCDVLIYGCRPCWQAVATPSSVSEPWGDLLHVQRVLTMSSSYPLPAPPWSSWLPSPPSSGWSKHSCRHHSLKQTQVHRFCLWPTLRRLSGCLQSALICSLVTWQPFSQLSSWGCGPRLRSGVLPLLSEYSTSVSA